MFNILASVRTLLEQHDELERILRKYLSGQVIKSAVILTSISSVPNRKMPLFCMNLLNDFIFK